MFSNDLAYTLEAAFREAAQRSHAYLCIEHLLFALLHDPKVADIIRHCGGDVEEMKRDIEKFFAENIEKIDTDADAQTLPQPTQTPAVQRLFQNALLQVHSSGRDLVEAKDILVALFNEKDSHALYYLKKQDITKLDLINYIAHGVSKYGAIEDKSSESDEDLETIGPESDDEADDDDEEDDERRGRRSTKVLKTLTEDLTELARQGKIDPVIGREKEIDRTLKVLSRRQKNNPLFIGDPGVGKTAMAHAIALKIVSGSVPESLRDAQIFSLNMGNLVAGTKFRGDFEDRLRKVVKELETLPNPILFIDEIHTMVGAGAAGSGSMDAANLLKPALAAGKIRCMGSTTYEDYKKSFEKDRALSRRFSIIELVEPSIEETIKIIEGLKEKFETHHKVKYSKGAIRSAAELSAKHITEKFLPDKAIDVIDEAGATNRMLQKSKRKKTLTETDIEHVVSLIARVPVKSVSKTDTILLKSLAPNIQQRVYGQDKAVEAITRAIKRSRASLKANNKPVGSFLFAGPTGVGKTELAKALAAELGVAFHRFDMSEYMEKHAVARLIGAPPGYVGYDEGGLLTDLVRKQPYAVLLFDEIEKAHEDIFNILLQIMDEATLTDSHGKKADFRNIVIIMTTNAGSEKAAAIGFGKAQAGANHEQAIKKLFKPEFRNRLDEIIHFEPLPSEVVEKIVDKLVKELEEQLAERKVTFALSKDARAWLAQKGFDALLGARPMARLIQKEIKDPLADEILFGKLQNGGKVRIELEGEKLKFHF